MSPDTELRTPAPPLDWITEQALLEEIRAHGLRAPRKSQLRLWGRKEVIQRPVQLWLPGEAGSRSYYPPKTVEQLARLLELRRGRRRSLDHLRFELWWKGFQVGSKPLRRFLVRFTKGPVREFAALKRRYPDPYDFADAVVRKFQREKKKSRSGFLRLFRHRLERDDQDLESLIWILAAMFAGGDPLGDETEDELGERSRRSIVEVAMGSVNATTDKAFGEGPWLADASDFRTALEELADANLLDPNVVSATFLGASDAELEDARSFGKILLHLATLADAMEAVTHKRDIFGFGQLAVFRRERQRLKTKTEMLFVALILLRIGSQENIDELREGTNGGAEVSAIAELARRNPGKDPLISPEELAQFNDLPEHEQSKIQEEIRRALRENPDLLSEVEKQQDPEQQN
jgi:hypothetical protein